MTAMDWAALPVLGAGVGFRSPFRAELFRHQQQVGFLEITADHFFEVSPLKREELNLLRQHFTLIPHGLHLSLGSADGLDEEYVGQLADLIQHVAPPWWSEHIAFTRAGGIDLGHLAPLPFSEEALEVLERNITQVKRAIEVPLILENITYHVSMPGTEMEEAHFLRTLLERTDCGLLLDVTNLYVNSVNHGYDAEAFLDALPPERVVQLHFAGGIDREEPGAPLIDTHSQATPPEVWALLEKVLARFPVRGVILERDANLPPFAEILEEVERVKELGRRLGRWE